MIQMGFSLYGVLVGLATAAVWISVEQILKAATNAKQWPESVWNIGLICVAGGALVGARLYHLATDWPLYAGHPFPDVFAIWNGGLGWYGALIGIILGVAVWRSFQKPPVTWLEILDSFALTLPWGQALGRWGNYFNQELFGPPTALPWGIFIEPSHRPLQWATSSYFHPLFLYESLGSVIIAAGLYGLWRWNRRGRAQAWPSVGSGGFMALYGLGFGTLRFSLDFLRYDLSIHWYGLSVSQWLSLLLILGSLAILQRSFRQWLAAMLLTGTMLLGSLVWFQTPAIAQAQNAAVDLSIVPAVVEIAIQPGKSVTRAFTIKNSGSTDLTAVVTLQEFKSDGHSGTPVLTDHSTFPYAKLANADRSFDTPFPLPAGGEQQVVLSINIPSDAQERDWYLVLLTKTKSATALPAFNSQASTQGSIGATLMIRISKTESSPLQWGLSFPKMPRFFDSLRPLHIEPFVENHNSSLAIPDLTITVRDWRGKLVLSQDGLPERVLAHSTRYMRAQKTSADDPRSKEPTAFVFDPPFAFGRYTVEGRISNQAGETLVVDQEVWALPISVIIVVIGAGVASVWVHLINAKKKRVSE